MTSRREALLILAALPILPACGGGGGTDAGTGIDSGGGGGACGGIVDDNHGHSISVPRADVMAGTPQTYDIRGSAGHSHTVSITATQFGILRDVGSLIVTSSNEGHSHQVTINCS